MIIINPVNVTSAAITSLNIPVTEAQWDAATTYAAGDKVITTTWGEIIYESVSASNVGNDPETDDGTNWAATVPSNAFAMFDSKIGTKSTNPDSIILETLTTGFVDGIAFFGLVGSNLQIEIYDLDGTTKIYDKTYVLRDYGSTSMYGYYFGDITSIDRVVKLDLPAIIAGSRIVITLTGAAGSDVAIGSLIYGRQFEIGITTLGGLSAGIKDFSTKENDKFGNFEVVERPFQDLLDVTVAVDNIRSDSVKNTLSKLRARPIVWVGDENKGYSVVFGFFTEFKLTLPTTAYGEYRIKINGVA